MRDITLMPNDYIVTHIKTDTICEHFNNDDVVYVVEEKVVPLVHCGECKFENTRKCPPHRMGLVHDANDYCSYGIRKTDGEPQTERSE